MNISLTIKAALPRNLKTWLKLRLDEWTYRGNLYECPVCAAGLNYFLPLPEYYIRNLDEYLYMHSILAEETLNVLQFACPACGAYDRDRLYKLYFDRLLPGLDPARKYRFIDFAPSRVLGPILERQQCLDYRSADLCDPGADDRVDITDMSIYPDESVDFFLCSHVLEHVPDDRKAMRELRRILRPGGQGIVMAPILLTLTATYENPAITSDADCWRHFGQNDHVRIYSRQGFIGRLEEAGFAVNQYGAGYFTADTFRRHGIHPRSVLYVVEPRPAMV